MTKPLGFTQASVKRAVDGARKAGLRVGCVAVKPDGTIQVHDTGESAPPPLDSSAAPRSKWEDAEA
jgi:hypothetical protein